MCIERGVCVFPSCLTLVSLRITLARETPTEMSSLPLGLTLGAHCFGIKRIHCNIKKGSQHHPRFADRQLHPIFYLIFLSFVCPIDLQIRNSKNTPQYLGSHHNLFLINPPAICL